MNDDSSQKISRREFIGQANCAGIGAASLFSTLLTLRLANSVAAQTTSGDYKALVCLFLNGGNDSFNMLVPTTPAEYTAYSTIRANLALSRDSLLHISPANLNGRTLGIHPAMPEIRDLFNAGNLAFVSNIGSLVRPTTRNDYTNNRYRPVSLYSHADQIKQWQTCIPDKRTAEGWGGRAADIINSLNNSSLVSMNISLAGQNVFLSGRTALPYSVNSTGATLLTGYDRSSTPTNNGMNWVRTTAIDSMLAAQYQSLFEQTYANSTKGAMDTYVEFTNMINGINTTAPVPNNPAPLTGTNSLAANMRMIARVAAGGKRAGLRRQVFFVQLGGWDHHDEVINNQQRMLAQVSQAVNAFWVWLGELGLRNEVTLFSASDFGRTLSSNGNGSDHAWGGNQFVLGGAVAGGRIAGSAQQGYYPDFTQLRNSSNQPTSTSIDVGQGRLIPGVAVDEMAADLLRWFGITSATELDYVLPGYSDRFAGRPELGLIGQGFPATAPSSPQPAPTPAPAPATSNGGGGGSLGGLAAGAAGAALVLKKLADRKRRLAQERNAAPPPAAK